MSAAAWGNSFRMAIELATEIPPNLRGAPSQYDFNRGGSVIAVSGIRHRTPRVLVRDA